MKHRSYLFVAGDRPERFDKAAASGAHAIILDLEDAVAPDRKEQARRAVADWLASRGSARAASIATATVTTPATVLQSLSAPVPLRVVVRINAADTAWYAADLALLGSQALSAVMLPKSEDADVLVALAARLRPDQVALPLVETVLGLDRARVLAGVAGVERLVFGSVDFNADSGIGGDGEELNAVRSMLVLASRLGGAHAPIDGISLALDNEDQLRADTLRARRFGYAGKLCIHPRQVAAVNAAFAPSAVEIEWARRVYAAVQKNGLGAIAVDGKLVDKPVYLLAQALLDEAANINGAAAG